MDEKKKLIKLIKNHPVKIARLVGFEDMTELHDEWLKKMIFNKEDQTLLAHRGSFKTSALSVAIALIMVLFPNLKILFMRKTDTDVIEIIKQIAKILSTSVFHYIVRTLYDVELVLLESTSTKITTNLCKSVKGTSQLLGMGINGSLTGKHFDIVITDDIVNIKDRISKAEREFTKLIYMELQNVKNRGGRIMNMGTPWHKEDCISTMPNKTTYDCYSTGLINRNVLEEIRQSMTPSLFAANYELKHIADSEALFGNPTFTNNKKLIYNGICHIDASYGGADGTAFTMCNQVGNKFYMYGKRWDKHVDDCLSEIYKIQEELKGGSISCERNADKGYLEKELIKDGKVVSGYSETTNKFIKISTYLRKHWKDIIWLEDTDPDYMNEILDYTENAEHDDAPDSASCCIRKLTGKRKWVY